MPRRDIIAGPFQPNWESLRQFECPKWFRDAKLGIWSHWGPQAVPMYGDWYARGTPVTCMWRDRTSTATIGARTAIRRSLGTRM